MLLFNNRSISVPARVRVHLRPGRAGEHVGPGHLRAHDVRQGHPQHEQRLQERQGHPQEQPRKELSVVLTCPAR